MMKKILIVALLSTVACTKEDTSADTTRVALAPPPAQTAQNAAPASSRTIKVYKDANCGCCKEWV
jgi:hypothetical protein